MSPNPASDDNQSRKTPGTLTLRQRILAMSLAALAGIGISFVAWQFVDRQTGQGSSGVVTGQSGVALVGGPFALTTHEGNAVTNEDFAGRYMLIYFGYTWCPDVCPLALQFMDDALTRLGDDADMIQPVFITIDPERDTPDVMKSYVASFHPRLIGLTGSPESIAQVADAYKMYYRKTEPLDPANPLSYGIDHMNIFFLMGPNGAYVAHFMSPTSPKDVAAAIATHLP